MGSAKTQMNADRVGDSDGSGHANPAHSRLRLAILFVSHFTLDFYAAMLPAIIGVVEARCQLDPNIQTPFLMVVITLVAGGGQPLFAMLSDRYDSRVYGALGVACLGVGCCAIGFPRSYPSLLLLAIVAYAGAGMYHPIAASSVGQLSRNRRSMGMSLFILFGMIGGAAGAYFVPRYVVGHELTDLIYLAPFAVVVAIAMHFSIRNLSHREVGHQEFHFEPDDLKQRWKMIWFLYLAMVARSIVYTILQLMFVRWVQGKYETAQPEWTVEQIADASAPWIGDLNSVMILGMGFGALVTGTVVRTGRERWAMVLIPCLFSPSVFLLPFMDYGGSCFMAFFVGIGFGSLSPLALSLGQRLLPHRTSLASALMLGGAWAVAAVGPQIGQSLCPLIGVDRVFYVAAGLMFASGLLGLPLRLRGYENNVPPRSSTR